MRTTCADNTAQVRARARVGKLKQDLVCETHRDLYPSVPLVRYLFRSLFSPLQ